MIALVEADLVEILEDLFTKNATPEVQVRILTSSQLDLGKLPDTTFNRPTVLITPNTISFENPPHAELVEMSVQVTLKVVAQKGVLQWIIDTLILELSFSRLITRSRFKVFSQGVELNTKAPTAQFRSADYNVRLTKTFSCQPVLPEKVAYPFLTT